MKNNLVEMFSYNKNGVRVKMLNYPRAGVRIRKIKMMVKDLIRIFPSKIHSRVKMMMKMRSQTKISPIKIHYQIKVMRNNPDKAHSERSKVEKNKNKVSNYKWGLVNNYKDVRMISR